MKNTLIELAKEAGFSCDESGKIYAKEISEKDNH